MTKPEQQAREIIDDKLAEAGWVSSRYEIRTWLSYDSLW